MKPISARLSSRAYQQTSIATSWEEIWEAGPYYDRVSTLLEHAEEFVVIVGWQIDSRISLTQDENQPGTQRETFRQKVIRLCEEKPNLQIYFLIWDHAYLYVLERELWQGRIWDNIHPRIHFVFDNRHQLGASHHEKLTLVDGRVALCGGIDLCDERWDSPDHRYSDPRRSLECHSENHGPYHDLAVQVTGPICQKILEHVGERWASLSSIPFPKGDRNSCLSLESQVGHQVYLSRTAVSVDGGSPSQCHKRKSVVREVEFLFRDLIQSAENRIILEGQYYWSEVVNDLLIAKIHQMTGKDFELILVLSNLQFVKSLTRFMMPHELKLLRKLELAAQSAGVKLTMGSPYVFPSKQQKDKKLGVPKPIYIHSKIIIIDDQFFGVGSANFATRALRVDTEIQLTLVAQNENDRIHIRQVASQILSHWQIDSTDGSIARGCVQDVVSEGGIYFRRFMPSIEIFHLKKEIDRTQSLPWSIFFDPSLPWFYSMKTVYLQLARRYSVVFRFSIIGLWLGGFLITSWIGGYWSQQEWVALLFNFALCSVGLVRIPFVITTVMAMLFIGAKEGIELSILAFWVSALSGYWMTRMFPSLSVSFYQKGVPSWLSIQLGRRSFSVLLSTLFDPRLGVCSKIVFQGIYCIPFPWFILGTLILLPAGMYGVLYGAGGLVFRPIFQSMSNSLR